MNSLQEGFQKLQIESQAKSENNEEANDPIPTYTISAGSVEFCGPHDTHKTYTWNKGVATALTIRFIQRTAASVCDASPSEGLRFCVKQASFSIEAVCMKIHTSSHMNQ